MNILPALPRTTFTLILTLLWLHVLTMHVTYTNGNILVVGSANLDTILHVHHLPQSGENIMTIPYTDVREVAGGKGCNQAIAAAKLQLKSSRSSSQIVVKFLGRFGQDSVAAGILRDALECNGVDLTLCDNYDSHVFQTLQLQDEENDDFIGNNGCKINSSGRGYVFLQQSDGAVSAVVVGGSNMEGWWPRSYVNNLSVLDLERRLEELLASTCIGNYNDLDDNDDVKVVMLQCEIPEYVNIAIAKIAKRRGWTVMLDIGGEERSLSSEMLQLCDFVAPNFTEMQRLCKNQGHSITGINENECDFDQIIKAARALQSENHANSCNILVTLGKNGSILVCAGDEEDVIIHQPPQALPKHLPVVDETGAGDCFRAAFVTAYTEHKSFEQCLRFASASGALAVTREGAVPSIPCRSEVESLLNDNFLKNNGLPAVLQNDRFRGGKTTSSKSEEDTINKYDEFPLMFGSRLNSMKDRPELWGGEQGVRGWVKRQGSIKGLGCVDFNFPQHFVEWSSKEAKQALDEVDLVAGAVCLRYPHHQFQQGAMTHPDVKVRQEAIELTKQAAHTARDLGASEVVVWSAYDGYDYAFQVDHNEKWEQIVLAFQECCDEFPDIKFSLEFKPTDENTRFFAVSTKCTQSSYVSFEFILIDLL